MPGHQDSTGSLPLVKQDTRIKHQSWEVRESGGRVGPYTVPHHDASRGDDSRWAVGDSPRSADLPFVASPTASASSPPRGLTNSPGFGVQRHPSTGDTLVQLAASPTHQPDAPTDEILDPPRSRGQRRASAMTHGSYPEQPGFRGGGPELAQDSSGWDQVVVATQAVKPTLPSLRPPSEPAAVRFVRRATHTPTRPGIAGSQHPFTPSSVVCTCRQESAQDCSEPRPQPVVTTVAQVTPQPQRWTPWARWAASRRATSGGAARA